jgi:DNA-directed RNA polymerase subunit RPC12/RpoP
MSDDFEGIRCPKCKNVMNMMVEMTVTASSKLYRRFSKKNIRSHDFQLYATNWPRMDLICPNEKCGYVILSKHRLSGP